MHHYTKPQLIKLIHIAKSKLSMDEDTYRSILMRIGKKTSSKDLSLPELMQVLEHLKQCGFKVAPPKRAGTLSQSKKAQAKKIRSLWLTLHTLGAIQDSSEYALSRYVKRMVKVDHLNWINIAQGSLLIESLKKWVKRIEVQNERTL